jgi:hypothetical protein
MIKKLLSVGVVLLLVGAVVALAADAVTGKWVYEQPAFGRGGGGGAGGAGGAAARPPVQVTLDLKADGAKLTGTILQPMGMGRGGGGGNGGGNGAAPPAPAPTPISNGKVDGNNVSFEVTRETQMGTMTTKYVGVIAGSDMKLSITRPGFQGGDPVTTDVAAKKQ